MCDAAGQLPDRLHLLRLAQRILRGLKLARAGRNLLFERRGKQAQRVFGATTFGGDAGAFGHLAHENDFVGTPASRAGIAQVQHRDEPAILHHRHVDDRARTQCLERLCGVHGPGIGARILDADLFAADQIVDIRSIVTERETAR